MPIPAETIRAVERLVGAVRAATFIALTAERQVRARALDDLTASRRSDHDLGESP
ncbi:hypothetical protein [Streptomyces shenzhenensis]|uniref:hypothetical protein n=1 Tax=Streptomyces shenzhenensis TaxID=943815 RepID=UPI003F53FC2D